MNQPDPQWHFRCAGWIGWVFGFGGRWIWHSPSPQSSASPRYTEVLGNKNMLATPEITSTNVQEAAVIRLTVPRSEMRKVFGPAVSELMAALAAQGIEPVGAVFAHHLKMSPDTFDFELGVSVSQE
jgi:hypothetical protein